MQNDSRFVVTKCKERLISNFNERRNSNMNTIEVKNLSTNGRNRQITRTDPNNRMANNLQFKEFNRNKWTNPDQSYTNTMFTLDESESEYSTLNFESSHQSERFDSFIILQNIGQYYH